MNQNIITAKIAALRASATEFNLLSKANFASGKTILRMTKIARQYWNEISDADAAVTEIYKQHGSFDEKINNYRVPPEKISVIDPLIREINEEVVEIKGTKFTPSELWTRQDKKNPGELPEILTPDLLFKLDWLIELEEID